MVHALEALFGDETQVPELVMMIQCTSPLTTADDLDGVVETLIGENADSCFIAVPFHHFVWKRDEDGEARGVNHEGAKRKRRQDLAPQYLENGAAYVMRTSLFLRTGERFCGKTAIYVADGSRALEIDEPVDFARAEATLRLFGAGRQASRLPQPVDAVVMDFDGVFTDNAVFVMQDGREAVRADRGDGMGLSMLRSEGIPLVILSKERNPVVSARAEKLGIECHQAEDDKLPALTRWAAAHGVRLEHTVYVGNDINDVECLRAVGCGVVPSDAHPTARAAANLVLERPGGHGALRELSDLILARKGESST